LNSLQKTIYNLKKKKPGFNVLSKKKGKPIDEDDDESEAESEYDEESYDSEE